MKTLQRAIHHLCLICTPLFLTHCSSDSGGSEDGANRLMPAVEAVQAQHGTLPLTERLTGLVKAKNQVEIYPEINAAIMQVHVQNGEGVKNGQPLVRLRDNEFLERLKQAKAGHQIAVAQARQAEAQLKEIQAELKRTEALAEKQLASDTELEAVQTRTVSAEADVELANARVQQAQATVDEREALIAQTIIRAPVAGTVGNRNAEVGMLVSSSTRLFTLGQLDCVRVEVILTDRMLGYIETGQRTEILIENSATGSISAPLSRISPFLHPVTHSTDAEIDLANPDGRLKSGMFVAVDVYYGESEEATLVPLSALYENPSTGATGVYVSKTSLGDVQPGGAMNDGEAVTLTAPVAFDFVPVEVIAKGRMRAGIRDVEPGSWVITIGQDLLGGAAGNARVRPVHWEWVEQLQHLQRQDLLQEIMRRQRAAGEDTAIIELEKPSTE
jgi:RND family efflux transporter MFP subunit